MNVRLPLATKVPTRTTITACNTFFELGHHARVLNATCGDRRSSGQVWPRSRAIVCSPRTSSRANASPQTVCHGNLPALVQLPHHQPATGSWAPGTKSMHNSSRCQQHRAQRANKVARSTGHRHTRCRVRRQRLHAAAACFQLSARIGCRAACVRWTPTVTRGASWALSQE